VSSSYCNTDADGMLVLTTVFHMLYSAVNSNGVHGKLFIFLGFEKLAHMSVLSNCWSWLGPEKNSQLYSIGVVIPYILWRIEKKIRPNKPFSIYLLTKLFCTD